MTMNLLHQRPTLDSLERQQLLWRQRQIVTASWLNLLTERAALLHVEQAARLLFGDTEE